MPKMGRRKQVKEEDGSVSALLPPCLVCDGKASGLHFGVNTCEACKAFFRRCLYRDKNTPLVCPAEQNCVIYHQNKFQCPFCRYQKCISVGMSKDAIKTGRYTLEHKADLMKQAKDEVSNVQTNQGHPQVAGVSQDPSELPSNKLPGLSAGVNKHSITSTSADSANGHSSDLTLSPDSMDSSASLHRSGLEQKDPLEQLTTDVLQAFQLYSPYTPEVKAKIPIEQSQYQAQRDLVEELFGPMKPLTRDEHREIFKTTGIDIDGRMEKAKTILPVVKQMLMNLTRFSRHVPGFTELPIEDQLTLVHDCSFEWWVVNALPGMNVGEGLYTNFVGLTQTKDEMKSISKYRSGNKIDNFFYFGGTIQDLELDETSQAMFIAICLINPDGKVPLVDKQKIEDTQHRLIEALLSHISKSRRLPLKLLTKILAVVSEMKTHRPNSEFMIPIKRHMAPIIHALICERPPNCRECRLTPCALHQQYHPNNLPVFKPPPRPLRPFWSSRWDFDSNCENDNEMLAPLDYTNSTLSETSMRKIIPEIYLADSDDSNEGPGKSAVFERTQEATASGCTPCYIGCTTKWEALQKACAQFKMAQGMDREQDEEQDTQDHIPVNQAVNQTEGDTDHPRMTPQES